MPEPSYANMIRLSTLLPLAALAAAALADDTVPQHDFEGEDAGLATVDVTLFDRPPHGVGIDRWANLMHNATHRGHWTIQGFDTMLPNRTAMDGWSVTYALNNWIDADTTLLHRVGDEMRELMADSGRHVSWPGAVVRLNPPEDLYARASVNYSFEGYGFPDEYVYPEDAPLDTKAYSARHKNWRVCAYRLSHIGDAESWFKAPNDGTCDGHLDSGCINKVAGQTISTNLFNAECPYLNFQSMSRRGSETPDECLTDFVDDEVLINAAVPRSSLGLRFRNWTMGSSLRGLFGEDREVLDEYDWLHGSELWSIGASMSITSVRLANGGWEEDGEELEDGDRFDSDLDTVVEHGQGLLLAWVHNDDGLERNTTSNSNVTFSLVCFNGINETSVGERRLEEVIDLYASESAAASISVALMMGVLALASSLLV